MKPENHDTRSRIQSMPCIPWSDDDGMHGWMCGEMFADTGTCADCHEVADFLCDYPVGDGKTCDRKMCPDHAKTIGINMHYCAAHDAMWRAHTKQD